LSSRYDCDYDEHKEPILEQTVEQHMRTNFSQAGNSLAMIHFALQVGWPRKQAQKWSMERFRQKNGRHKYGSASRMCFPGGNNDQSDSDLIGG